MAQKANLANALLALGITASATTISLQSGQGANMPTTLPYKLTLAPFAQLPTKANSEIVLVTARSTDTLTVLRGVNGTTARAFVAGDIASNGVYIENSTAVGDIVMTFNTSPQDGRLFMDGGTYNKSDYPLLYDHVVNNPGYGATTSTTFTLRDMRGRVPVGKAASGTFVTLASTGGAETHKLTIAEMPSHNHYIDGITVGSSRNYTQFGADSGLVGGKNTNNTGGDQAHNNLQPYIVTNYEVIAG